MKAKLNIKYAQLVDNVVTLIFDSVSMSEWCENGVDNVDAEGNITHNYALTTVGLTQAHGNVEVGMIYVKNQDKFIKKIDSMTLPEIKTYAIETFPRPAQTEITLANNLKFDDTEKSLNYLQNKRATSNASETVYDKYNNSETMTNAQLTTAVGVIASSIMAKDDEVKAKIVQIDNAQSITEVQLIAGLLQEKTVKLIVDVDGIQFDDVNQVTDEVLNQVVMPVSGSLDLSTISWLNAKGVKSINGQATSPQQIIDSNTVHTANVTFSADSHIVTGEVVADGAPVTVDMVVYVA